MSHCITLDQIDRVGQLITQIGGIMDCVAAASDAEISPPDNAIRNAVWAANTLLDGIGAILYALPPAAESAGNQNNEVTA